MTELHSNTLYPLSELTGDVNMVLLWRVPICEPPDLAFPDEINIDEELEDGGYTHFTIVPEPDRIVVDGVSMSYEYWKKNVKNKAN